MNILANTLTLLSLLCGFMSIIFALEQHFTFATWAIIFSVILDGIDGQIARRNPIPSAFGKELDSLVDVISFGIAPAILGYIFVYRDFHLWASVLLFFYLGCSVWRLAKYNITPKEKLINHFSGLPTTVSGGVLASFILMHRITTEVPSSATFLFLVTALACLMISKFKYLNLEAVKSLLFKNKILLFVVVAAAISIVGVFYVFTGIFLPEISIFALFMIYVVFSPFLLRKTV